MKRAFILISSLFFIMFSSGTTLAYDFDISFTGDNIVSVFLYQDDVLGDIDLIDLAGYTGDPSLGDWQTATTLSFGVYHGSDIGYPFSLVWEIENSGAPSDGNPGGFLASFVDNDSSGDPLFFSDGSLVSSFEWLVSVDGVTWYSATQYGANNSSTIWYNNNGGPVAGIADAAQWIWWEDNFAKSPESLYVRVDVGNHSVPEPFTLLLLTSGLLGLAGMRKRFQD